VISWKLNPDNVKEIVDGLYGVVNEGGTGGRARLPGISVCGKTGTAQLTSEDYAKSQGRKTSDDNAWFVGFAPCYNPEIVVAALFEHFPGHGQYAAPIVRDILKAYFDKKARLAQAAQMTAKLNSFSVTPAAAPQVTRQPAAAASQSDPAQAPASQKGSEIPAEPPPPPAIPKPRPAAGTPQPGGGQ